MSDLTATNCGCNDGCGCGGSRNNSCSSIIWIIILLSLCGNNGMGGCNDGCGIGNGFGGDNSCCLLLLLLLCCGNGFGC